MGGRGEAKEGGRKAGMREGGIEDGGRQGGRGKEGGSAGGREGEGKGKGRKGSLLKRSRPVPGPSASTGPGLMPGPTTGTCFKPRAQVKC